MMVLTPQGDHLISIFPCTPYLALLATPTPTPTCMDESFQNDAFAKT